MNRPPLGTYDNTAVGDETVQAFMPTAQPPAPPLDLAGQRQCILERATLVFGRLDSVSTMLPEPQHFLYAYVWREAVFSSQIEGTKSCLSDLLLFELEEAPGTPFDDVVEVSNYIAALEHGMDRQREGFSLCNRLLREMHEHLMSCAVTARKPPASSVAARTGDLRHAPPTMAALSHPSRTPWMPSSMRTPAACPSYSRPRLPTSQFETDPFLECNRLPHNSQRRRRTGVKSQKWVPWEALLNRIMVGELLSLCLQKTSERTKNVVT